MNFKDKITITIGNEITWKKLDIYNTLHISAGQLETEADSAVLVETEVGGEDTTFVNPGHVDGHVDSYHGNGDRYRGNGGDATDDIRWVGNIILLIIDKKVITFVHIDLSLRSIQIFNI